MVGRCIKYLCDTSFPLESSKRDMFGKCWLFCYSFRFATSGLNRAELLDGFAPTGSSCFQVSSFLLPSFNRLLQGDTFLLRFLKYVAKKLEMDGNCNCTHAHKNNSLGEKNEHRQLTKEPMVNANHANRALWYGAEANEELLRRENDRAYWIRIRTNACLFSAS